MIFFCKFWGYTLHPTMYKWRPASFYAPGKSATKAGPVGATWMIAQPGLAKKIIWTTLCYVGKHPYSFIPIQVCRHFKDAGWGGFMWSAAIEKLRKGRKLYRRYAVIWRGKNAVEKIPEKLKIKITSRKKCHEQIKHNSQKINCPNIWRKKNCFIFWNIGCRKITIK